MSRFYGSMDGSAKTTATRRGHSSLHAHIRGWDSGIRVEAVDLNGEDAFYVYATYGSNGGEAKGQLIGRVRTTASGPLWVAE